ncbi:MAG: hypothetical protein ACI30K_08220 [Muribaculaceae bacterium]
MKTSFYFVIWILVYPLLELLHSPVINENLFLVACLAVIGLSVMLRFLIPGTIAYDKASRTSPILEDVYTANVASFMKRLRRDTNIEIVSALYFTLATITIVISIVVSGTIDLAALIIFGILSVSSIYRCISLVRASAGVKATPTPEQCMYVAEDTYGLDYTAYYEQRNGASYQDVLPKRPKFFTIFTVVSIVFAIIALLLGLLCVIAGLLLLLEYTNFAYAGITMLYGTLAMCFGVKDIIECRRTKLAAAALSKGKTPDADTSLR